jgi:choline dehydrogenase-like flavoprotein
MIADFNTESPNEGLADLCLIGGGAVGIAIAREFIGAGRRVLVLEGGGPTREAETDDLYASLVEGQPHAGVHSGRARVFGGATTLWGGQALPLFPLDFEARDWVPHSGWPVSRSEIARFHDRVLRLLGMEEDAFGPQVRHIQGRDTPAFSPEQLQLVYSQWSPAPNFASRYRRELEEATDVEVWLHANVTEIVPAPDGKTISHLIVQSLQGHSTQVAARFFVICCGGIETARLLLASRSHFSNGIGNANDLVGRYFQDHVSVACGIVRPLKRKLFRETFDQSFDRGVKFYPKIAAAEALQRRERMLSAIANIYSEMPADDAIAQAKALAGDVRSGRWSRVTPGRLVRALGSGLELAPAAWRVLVQRRVYTSPRGTIRLELHVEQEPNPQSRIMLSADRCDALGMPRTVVHWRPTQASRRTARIYAQAIAAEFLRLGLATVELSLPADVEEGWDGYLGDLSHHMGTARMAEHARNGVTDPRCRVHDLPNLYVASSAVFPTSGSSNPTFTLLALAYRIADEIRPMLQ